jgi:hypothetical protein
MVVLLFRGRPRSGAAVRSLERSGAAAAGSAAGTDDGDAAVMADGVADAVGADGSREAFANDPAAGHNHRRRAVAGTPHGTNDPRAVEITAAAARQRDPI